MISAPVNLVPGEKFVISNSLAAVWAVQKRFVGDKGLAMKLAKHFVEKPWGRTDVPADFGDLGDQQIGEIWYERDGPDQLPILVKWLFTSEKLSIQVHPNDDQARARGLTSGKEECWVIISAEPGAVLGMGTKRTLDSDGLRAASLSGEIEQLMEWKPVKAGDYFYIPAGTVHAIGAGITLVEVQQFADITYRLYDYGRPRELHLDDGVAVSVAKPYDDERSGTAQGNMALVDGPHFRLALLSENKDSIDFADAAYKWVVPLSGSVTVGDETAGVGDCLLVPGDRSINLGVGGQALISAV
jgi:mannose-6-phosphate isomerase